MTRRGRPPGAPREAVLDAGLRRYLRGERVDVRAIAMELGVSRNTIHTWFGGREGLISEVVAGVARELLERCRRETGGTGGTALVDTFDRFNRALSAAPALRQFVDQEREFALRILTSRDGIVERSNVAAIAALIDAEVTSGAYSPPVQTDLLAYAIVRLAEAFLFGETSFSEPGELDRLREIEATLLHVQSAGPRA